MTAPSTALQVQWYTAQLHAIGALAGAVFVDVGAHDGALSQALLPAIGSSGTLVSIEPLRSNVRRIEARIAASGADNWTVQPVAISDHDGELELRVAAFGDPAGDAAPDAVLWSSAVVGPRTPATARRVRVPCLRLRSAVPEATVVKLDIEGHEYDVLDDALGELPGVRAWALELHMLLDGSRPLQGVIGKLARAGFDCFAAGRHGDDPSWRSRPIDASLGWNAIPWARARATVAPDPLEPAGPRAAAARAHAGAEAGAVKSLHVLALRRASR